MERKGRKSPLVPFFFSISLFSTACPLFSTCSSPVPTTISSFCYQEKNGKERWPPGNSCSFQCPHAKPAMRHACCTLSPSLVRCPLSLSRTGSASRVTRLAHWHPLRCGTFVPPAPLVCLCSCTQNPSSGPGKTPRSTAWFKKKKRLVPLPLYMPYHPDLLHQHLFLENKGPIHTIQAHRSRRSYTSFER